MPVFVRCFHTPTTRIACFPGRRYFSSFRRTSIAPFQCIQGFCANFTRHVSKRGGTPRIWLSRRRRIGGDSFSVPSKQGSVCVPFWRAGCSWCESLRLLGRLPCCWRRDFAVDWVLQLSAFVDFYEPNKYIGKPMTESVLRELRGYFGVLPNST